MGKDLFQAHNGYSIKKGEFVALPIWHCLGMLAWAHKSRLMRTMEQRKDEIESAFKTERYSSKLRRIVKG